MKAYKQILVMYILSFIILSFVVVPFNKELFANDESIITLDENSTIIQERLVQKDDTYFIWSIDYKQYQYNVFVCTVIFSSLALYAFLNKKSA